MFFEENFGSLRTFVRKQDGFGLGSGIVNVTVRVQAIQNIPTVAFPRSESDLVLKCGQVQQC